MLEPATPNPFRSEIAIHYAIASPGHAVDIAVFDAKGRLVKRLFSGIKPPGRYVVTWDGRTGEDKAAPAGVYFCRMKTEERTTSTKIIRTK
jgi:flagellar hook assembly protein FlgD